MDSSRLLSLRQHFRKLPAYKGLHLPVLQDHFDKAALGFRFCVRFYTLIRFQRSPALFTEPRGERIYVVAPRAFPGIQQLAFAFLLPFLHAGQSEQGAVNLPP